MPPNVNISTISRIESGAMQYNDEMLAAILKYMEIENAPFAEHEIEAYKDRLWVINDLITADRTAEARTAINDMFPVTKLPYEHDLSLLYTMTETRIFFKESNIPAAEEKIKAADAFLDGASDEALILYHRNKGFLYQARGDIKNSLKQYLLVADIESTILPVDAGIFYNIGVMYLRVGKLSLATSYFERANLMYDYGRTNVAGPLIDNNLIACYQTMGLHGKAKKLLIKALSSAKSIGDPVAIGDASTSLALTYGYDGDIKTGLLLMERGLELLKYSDFQYKVGLYDKVCFLIIAKKYNEANDAIALGKSLSKDDEVFTIMFESLECQIKLQSSQKDNAAAEYISNVAIPYLKQGNLSYRSAALGLCDSLETYYKKHRNTKMAMATAAVARDIYKEMFIGDVE